MPSSVSIITPSLNQGAFLEATIQSVLKQDYRPIEYVVVDGGSTDNTLDVLDRYGAKVRWVSEKDNGTAHAIQKGIGMTSGDIVGWLSSDDVLLEGAVRKAVNCLLQHPEADLVYGQGQYIDLRGNRVGEYPTAPFELARLAARNVICQPAAFFRRDAYLAIGGIDARLHYAFDYDLWIRLGQRFQARYLREFLACYRLHAASKTVAGHHALRNHQECLATVRTHYGWAPANRVYGCCYHQVASRLPLRFQRWRAPMLLLTLPLAIGRYLRLNRGFRLADLALLDGANLKKLWAGPGQEVRVPDTDTGPQP